MRFVPVRLSALPQSAPAPTKDACGGKSHHMAAPLSPFRVVGGCVSLFSSRVGFLVGQRVSNPTTINSGWGEGGPWYGTNPGGHKTGMGGGLVPFADGQPATMRKAVRRLSHVRLPQSASGASKSCLRQQKSPYGCPPLPIPCCWWLCFSLFLSRWFCWWVRECQIQPQSTPDKGRGALVWDKPWRPQNEHGRRSDAFRRRTACHNGAWEEV